MFNKIFSITEEYRLSESYIIFTLLGIKLKFHRDSILGELLLPFKKSVYNCGKNNKIFVINRNGEKKLVKKIKGLAITFKGDNNTITIHKPYKFVRCEIAFFNSNSNVEINANFTGRIRTILCETCNMKIGKDVSICYANIALIANSLIIGDNCLLSNNIRIMGDAHSVIDYETKEVLNKPTNPIKIGNHVWIGEQATLTKNASIPNDSIVGIRSVVTKAFDEEHVVIAGTPAKIVKRNISWDGKSPLTYTK